MPAPVSATAGSAHGYCADDKSHGHSKILSLEIGPIPVLMSTWLNGGEVESIERSGAYLDRPSRTGSSCAQRAVHEESA